MYDKNALLQTLLDLDEEVYLSLASDYPSLKSKMFSVGIVGGTAFVLRDLTSRTTTLDIDVIAANNELKGIMKKYPLINQHVFAYMDSLPFNYEDRLVLLPIETKAISYLSPSLEDLIVMKLYGARDNDMIDITSEEVLKNVNWSLLDDLVYSENEAKASALSANSYEWMKHRYGCYRSEYCESDI